MNIRPRVEELLHAARKSRELLMKELEGTEQLIAALELATEVEPGTDIQSKTMKIAKKMNGNGKHRRRIMAAPGEMRSVILKAFDHNGARPMLLRDIVRYADSHRPPSLSRKRYVGSTYKRVQRELRRMKVDNLVTGVIAPGRKRPQTWTLKA